MSSSGLLEQAIDAHGGLERWQRVKELAVSHRSGGLAFAAKFQGRTLAPQLARMSTQVQRIELTPFPPGDRGVFDSGAVRIETRNGQRVSERRDARADLHTPRRLLWWDKLDLLYFTGSVFWSYLTAPFIFTSPGFQVQEIEPWKEGADTWRRLLVTFPDWIRTHSRQQTFYFDADGLLRRLDYTAEEFGRLAKAAHYCSDHKEFGGLVFPTRRRVLIPRSDGRPRPYPLLIWIDIQDVVASV